MRWTRCGVNPMPERIQLRRTAGWRKPEGAVVVARPTRWGNPFPVCEHRSREQAVEQFSQLLRGVGGWDLCEHVKSTRYPDWGEVQRVLADRDLCCWCPPGGPCHADVLLRIANEPDEGGA